MTIAGSSKWKNLAEDIRANRIGVIALQETHLTASHATDIEKFHRHLKIFNSRDPQNPSGAAGVALVFNKLLTNTETVVFREVVPGRAVLASWEWHRGDELTIMAVYAPTDKNENTSFWETVEEKLRNAGNGFPKPEIVLGDFNMVEDAIDRFPAHMRPIDGPTSFASLKRYLKIKDGWRDTFPDKVDWTWRNAARSSMSRIDRIYLSQALITSSRNWGITISGLNANDHSRVHVDIANLDAPEIGRGRWTMSQEIANDSVVLDKANAAAKRAKAEMEETIRRGRTHAQNPQRIWESFKREVVLVAKKRQREKNCTRHKKQQDLDRKRQEAKERLRLAPTSPQRNEARQNLRAVESEIRDHQLDEHRRVFENRDARVTQEAESMTKSWFRWTKENKPRDTIATLRDPESDLETYISDSKKMAELAGRYHNGIQTADVDVDEHARSDAIRFALQNVKREMGAAGRKEAAAAINRDAVAESLNSAKNGSAAGLDGIIYEFWKAMNRKFCESRVPDEWVDILGIMTLVFTDVEDHGVLEDSGFADGWICPLYKKGDRTDVKNYRPITLLNTDYKTYTKALALKLARAAPGMIHEAQAGFVRGRSITNLTKITSLILNYAEAFEENGAIIALDQEKAYDRIRHDYLGMILRQFKVPERMVRVIESLYAHATTRVMINGHLSAPFQVSRGVRQGDPLSCLLFNLAIEPLAEMLRGSKLKGYAIEGLTEKLIATLYADDTTVYLSSKDSLSELTSLLDKWCLASGAKFNKAKTEVIPLGKPSYREQLWTSRLFGEDREPLPPNVRVAKDGETTRILGTWPGNKVKIANAWSSIMDRTQETLDRWLKHFPTLNGKGILSRVYAGGYTQYLTAAQGMPKPVEKQLDDMVLDFFWEGAKRHPVNMQTLRGPKERGGLELFCAEDRNDAQYIVWLREYLAPDSHRPIWAHIADPLFRAATIATDKSRVPEAQRTNVLCQSWRANPRKLPFILQQLLRVSKKYHLTVDAVYIPQPLREKVKVWSHPAMIETRFRNRRPWTLRCLKTHHAVQTVEDLEELAEIDVSDHDATSNCACDNCFEDRREGCLHPHRCQEMAAELVGSIAGKWNPAADDYSDPEDLREAFAGQRREALVSGETMVFHKRHTVPSTVESMSRIFVNSTGLAPMSASETIRREAGRKAQTAPDQDSIQAVLCAGMTMDGTDDARGGFAITFPDGEHPDFDQACTGREQTYMRALALGLVRLIELVRSETTLHVIVTNRALVRYMTWDLEKHENSGWTTVKEAGIELRAAAAALRSRRGETSFYCVHKKKRAEWPEVKATQERATANASFADSRPVGIRSLAPFDLPGLAIGGITQRVAHRAIRQIKSAATPERRETKANIAQIKSDLKQHCGRAPTTGQIWKGLQNKDISRKARNFLWKAVHGALKIGPYFAKMPEPWKSMERCPTCEVTETLEHILLDCPDSRQDMVWSLVKSLFEKRRIFAGVSIGTILGCANVRLQGFASDRDAPRERTYRIVVAESAFLAWKIRCEKRIEHADDPNWQMSDSEVRERWGKVLSSCELSDKISSHSKKVPKHSIRPWLAWATWRDVSQPDSMSFLKMLRELGVLVGREYAFVRKGFG